MCKLYFTFNDFAFKKLGQLSQTHAFSGNIHFWHSVDLYCNDNYNA